MRLASSKVCRGFLPGEERHERRDGIPSALRSAPVTTQADGDSGVIPALQSLSAARGFGIRFGSVSIVQTDRVCDVLAVIEFVGSGTVDVSIVDLDRVIYGFRVAILRALRNEEPRVKYDAGELASIELDVYEAQRVALELEEFVLSQRSTR